MIVLVSGDMLQSPMLQWNSPIIQHTAAKGIVFMLQMIVG